MQEFKKEACTYLKKEFFVSNETVPVCPPPLTGQFPQTPTTGEILPHQ
jgi:hypothetical protein